MRGSGRKTGLRARTYRRDGAGVTASVLGDGAAVYTPDVSQRRAGATTFDLADRLGTASRQTNAAKSTTATRSYDAFGMLVSTTGSPKGPFGFAGAYGYQEDGDTGLKLLGHRVYDPSTGRFLTRDPIKDGRNWVAYCGNDPLGGVDPSGLTWVDYPGHSGFQIDSDTGRTRPTPGGPFDLSTPTPPKGDGRPILKPVPPKRPAPGINDPGGVDITAGDANGGLSFPVREGDPSNLVGAPTVSLGDPSAPTVDHSAGSGTTTIRWPIRFPGGVIGVGPIFGRDGGYGGVSIVGTVKV